MKFTKQNRYGEPFWFNGIYKIVKYDYSTKRGAWDCEHYHCYLVVNQGKQWGDYVDRSKQKGEDLTFSQCVALCNKHSKTYQPTKRELENAAKAQANWINNQDKWGKEQAA